MGAGSSAENPSAVAITPARPAASSADTSHSPSFGTPGPVPGSASGNQHAGQTPGGTTHGDGQWQYGGADGDADSSDFKDFAEAANERMEAAFKGAQPTVQVSIGKQLYTVEFARCSMRHGGNPPRPIRRVVLESTLAAAPSASADVATELFDDEAGEAADSAKSAAEPSADRVRFVDNGRLVCINRSLARNSPETITLASTAKAHNSLVYCAAFSNDGKTIATGGRDGTLRFWELDTGYIIRNFKPLDAVVLNCAIAPSRSLIATGADDSSVRVYDPTKKDTPVHTLIGHRHKVYGVDFTSDSRAIVTGSMDQKIHVWDTNTGKFITRYEDHTSSVFTVRCSTFSPYTMASGADDNTVRLFDLRQRETAAVTFTGHSATIWAVDINFDETLVASSGMDSKVLLWDPRKPDAPVLNVGNHGRAPVHCVEFCGEGNRLLSCSRDATWRLWDVSGLSDGPHGSPAADDGHVARDATADPCVNEVARVSAHEGVVFGCAYSQVRGQVLSIGADAYVRLWNARL